LALHYPSKGNILESKNIDYKPVNSKFGSLNVRMVTTRDI
jgi:hypothetical protein